MYCHAAWQLFWKNTFYALILRCLWKRKAGMGFHFKETSSCIQVKEPLTLL